MLLFYIDVLLIKKWRGWTELGGTLGRKDCAGRDAGTEGLCWEGPWVGRSKLGGTLGDHSGRTLGEWQNWDNSWVNGYMGGNFGTEAGRKACVCHGGNSRGRDAGRKQRWEDVGKTRFSQRASQAFACSDPFRKQRRSGGLLFGSIFFRCFRFPCGQDLLLPLPTN